MQTMRRQPIPMVVIGGYLGAGKTTLLNRLLSDSGGLRIAVLVNDFGAINIDAALIRTRSDDVIQLENGCVCCSIGDKLVQALAAIGERDDPPDLLVIEASGVSDPTRIAQVGMLDRAFQLNAVVMAVDGEQLGTQLADPLIGGIVCQQIAGATVLVLTKADLLTETQRQQAMQAMAELAPRAMVMTAEHGALPMSVFLDSTAQLAHRESALLKPGTGMRAAAADLLHGEISSFSFQTHRLFDKLALKQLLRHLPMRLLRAKGIVRFADKADAREIHVVGGKVRITDYQGDSSKSSSLVFIGCFSPDEQAEITLRLHAALEAQAL